MGVGDLELDELIAEIATDKVDSEVPSDLTVIAEFAMKDVVQVGEISRTEERSRGNQ